MNEEKINLVLMDICGRLPHGVITKNCKNNFDVPAHMLPHVNGIKLLIAEYDLKPYLRPMSSMTDGEKEHCGDLILHEEDWMSYYDYLDSRYLDYRGLIPMGLALPATEGMYK